MSVVRAERIKACIATEDARWLQRLAQAAGRPTAHIIRSIITAARQTDEGVGTP